MVEVNFHTTEQITEVNMCIFASSSAADVFSHPSSDLLFNEY